MEYTFKSFVASARDRWVGGWQSMMAAFWICLVSLPGCVHLVSREPSEPFRDASSLEFPAPIRTLTPDNHYSQIPSASVVQQLQGHRPGEPIRILALSGGGAGGAFGAGALVGLTQSGQRPEFAVVTGVSAGALIAPYAFLGSAWDRELSDIYTSGVSEHVLQSRGLGAVFGSSLYRGLPLRQLVDRYATDALISAVAREASKGRLLLVATTNLETAEPTVWDLGAIAMNGGPNARALFCDVLVAAASVPGIFPPVVIKVPGGNTSQDETHIDGDFSSPFFVQPTPQELPVDALGTPPNTVYVLIDTQLTEPVRGTRRRATSILSRGILAGLSGMLRTTLELTAARTEQRGIELNYAAIPASYPYRGAFEFNAAVVKALFQYGYDCASVGRLWTTFRHSSATDNRDRDALVASDLKCPADDEFIAQFAESQR
jgi:predicted acylesterase/phospholipase RssA